jgi:hypothetical protein
MTNVGWVECTTEEPKDRRHDNSISSQKLEFGWDIAWLSGENLIIYPYFILYS